MYSDRPTISTEQPVESPTVEVALPVIAFPIITSPRQGVLIEPIDDVVHVTGTGPPSRALTILSVSGDVLASTTSDRNGNWRVLIASSLFEGSQQNILAELLDGSQSGTVSFSIKSDTFLERIIHIFGIMKTPCAGAWYPLNDGKTP